MYILFVVECELWSAYVNGCDGNHIYFHISLIGLESSADAKSPVLKYDIHNYTYCIIQQVQGSIYVCTQYLSYSTCLSTTLT